MGSETTNGHSVALTLNMSEAVAVVGSPVLVLGDGGIATYDKAHSTATALVFDYTVAAGQQTSDLRIAGVELPTGASISDLAGNNAMLSGSAADLKIGVNTRYSPSSAPATGNFVLSGSTDLELFGASSAAVSFASGAAATLKLDDPQQFGGQISGFGGKDQLDFADIGFSAHTTLAYQANAQKNGGTLTVSDGWNTAHIALLGQYAASSFVKSSDGLGGTLISAPAVTAQNHVLAQPHA
jgi:hypothetical protein